MKTIYILLLLVISANLSANVKSLFSPKDNLIGEVVEQINKTDSSIDIAIYTFNSQTILDSLLVQLDKGVEVRMIINRGQTERVREFVMPLINKGGKLKFVTRINHHKYIIFDKKRLYSSSGNFSDSPRQASYDESVFVCDNCHNLIDAFQNEFNYLYQNGHFISDHSYDFIDGLVNRADQKSVFFTSPNFNPIHKKKRISFKVNKRDDSGLGAISSKMVEAINQAEKSIVVATGHFRSYPLFIALSDAVKRGVKVDIVMDSQEYISKSWEDVEDSKVNECIEKGKSLEMCYRKGVHFSRKANDSGLNVYIKYYAIRWFFPNAPQMHNKYMIVDNQTLYTGSYNWSYNAEFNTFENVAVIKYSKIIKSYLNNFKSIISYGKDLTFSKMMNNLINEKEEIPLFFKAKTLTISQIDKVKKVIERKCPEFYLLPITNGTCLVKND